MSRHNTRRAPARTALTLVMVTASAAMALGCARTSWSRSSAEGPRIVLHPDTRTTVQTPVVSAPDIN